MIEERFGFNRVTLKLYVIDAIKHLLVGAVLGIPLLLVILWLMKPPDRCGGCTRGWC